MLIYNIHVGLQSYIVAQTELSAYQQAHGAEQENLKLTPMLKMYSNRSECDSFLFIRTCKF